MSYVRDNLQPGEDVVSEARISIVPFFLSFIYSWLFLFIPSFVILMNTLSSEYVLTTRRVFGKSGFISRHTWELPLESVTNVDFSQALFGRIFNYGSIHARAASGSGVRIGAASNPSALRNAISQQAEVVREAKAYDQTRKLAAAMQAAATPPAAPTVYRCWQRIRHASGALLLRCGAPKECVPRDPRRSQ